MKRRVPSPTITPKLQQLLGVEHGSSDQGPTRKPNLFRREPIAEQDETQLDTPYATETECVLDTSTSQDSTSHSPDEGATRSTETDGDSSKRRIMISEVMAEEENEDTTEYKEGMAKAQLSKMLYVNDK